MLFSLPYLKTASCKHTGTLSFYTVINKIRVHSILYPQDKILLISTEDVLFTQWRQFAFSIFSIEFKNFNFYFISARYTCTPLKTWISILYPQDKHPFNQHRRRTFHPMTSICLFYIFNKIKKLKFDVSGGKWRTVFLFRTY